MDTLNMGQPMPDANKCPQCGTPLPTGALAGLCPACLLKLGAAADTVTDARQPAFNPPAIAELAPLFPQLDILELIGKGGMGAVYKARQKQLDRIVALKILPPGIGNDPAFAGRFAREARALAKLNHPGIVTLYEFGETSGQFYFLMEFVDGVNLRQLLATGRVSAREALAIVPQICDALQFAHDQGIVHRDIKPENILLDRRGRVKVADFGLAKIMGGESDGPAAGGDPAAGSSALTDAGKLMGTPQYMSPEQITAPGGVDHRADIYALGVVFYQMLTGELPGKKIEPPSRKVQIDVRLDEIVLRALEKKPELRYQQASVLKTQLETMALDDPQPAPGTSTQPRPSHAAVACVVCIVIALVSLVLAGIVHQKTTAAAPEISRLMQNNSAIETVNSPLIQSWSAMIHLNRYVLSPLAVLGTFGALILAGLMMRQTRRSQTDAAVAHAVEAWLALMDNRDYAKSWETAAPYFQRALPKEEWVGRLQKIRHPLGPVLSRKLSSMRLVAAKTRWQVKYETSFDGLLAATETVTFALQSDGSWKAIGYLIRPASRHESNRGWRWFGITVLAVVVILIGLIVVESVIPNLIWERKKHSADLQRAAAAKKFGPVIPYVAPEYPGFGPVIELTLPLHPNGYTDTLDPDSGEILPTPDMDTPWDWAATFLPNGIMIIPQTAAHPTILAGTSTLVCGLPAGTNDNWDGPMALSDAEASGGMSIHLEETVMASSEGELPRIFSFQTPLGRRGLLEVTSLAGNPPGVKIRYRLVTNTPAFVETWSPTNAPGEKPDPQGILNEASDLMKQGRYEEALQRHIWYHNHALQYDESQSGVRLSSALSGWVELGRRYPKAKIALIQIRDQAAGKLMAGRGYVDLFIDVEAINRELPDEDATYALFKTIREKDPQLANQCYFWVESLLVAKGEYQWCYDHMGDPEFRFDSIRNGYEMQLSGQERIAQIQEKNRQTILEMNQKNGRTNEPVHSPPDYSAMMIKSAQDRFVGSVLQLIKILAATGHDVDAGKIRAEALAVLDDPRLHAGTGDASSKNSGTNAYPGDWIWEPDLDTLNQVPPTFLLRPSTLPTTAAPYDMMGKDRYQARGKTLQELIERVWSQKNSAMHLFFVARLPDDKFDFIVAGQPLWWDKLQDEIDRRFHLVEQIENHGGSEVVVIKDALLDGQKSPVAQP